MPKSFCQKEQWAIRATRGDANEARKALRAWAKKNGEGLYTRELVATPETTYEHNDYLRSIGRL